VHDLDQRAELPAGFPGLSDVQSSPR
jgi:hypothetical protein